MPKPFKNKEKRKSYEVIDDSTTSRGGALQAQIEQTIAFRRPTGIGGWIFTICFCATLSGFLAFGLWNSTMNVTSQFFGTDTTGVVVKKYEQAHEHDDKYFADFSFEGKAGTGYGSCDLDFRSYNKIAVGDKVPVRYWSGLPVCSAYINLPGHFHLNFGLLIATAIGLVLWWAIAISACMDLTETIVGWWRNRSKTT